MNRQITRANVTIPPTGRAWLPWATRVLAHAATAPLRRLRMTVSKERVKLVEPSPVQPAPSMSLGDYLQKTLRSAGGLGIAILAKESGVDQTVLRAELMRLREKGLVKRSGWARGAVWSMGRGGRPVMGNGRASRNG